MMALHDPPKRGQGAELDRFDRTLAAPDRSGDRCHVEVFQKTQDDHLLLGVR